ncbi:MAG: thiamine pyrophosphate-dependent enzyme [Candidatus Hodarchaeales archaeon]|jgi:pyruvate ferredoxin oxidoreductase beta subunit
MAEYNLPKLTKEHYADDFHLFGPGHTSCAGCGQAIAARLVLAAAGKKVIVANSTGCLEVFSSNFPENAWHVPWMHSLFENSASIASGIEAALRAEDKLDEIRVIAQGGDGGTADIGFGAISGMWERGHDILQICYDNGAYMNTGVQRSGLTPLYSSTTTSPSGKVSYGNPQPKKNLPEIAVAHGIPYVATASVAFHKDLMKKVKKALAIRGPKYLQIYVPCPLGHRHATDMTIPLALSIVETGLYPLLEWTNGQITGTRRLKEFRPVEEYLKPQRRFAHLFKPGAKEALKAVQEYANMNIQKYGLQR